VLIYPVLNLLHALPLGVLLVVSLVLVAVV
jgi:hypothetical protein